MLVTPVGIATNSLFTPCMRFLPSFDSKMPLADVKLALSLATIIDINLLLQENALVPMHVTLLGITIVKTLVQP